MFFYVSAEKSVPRNHPLRQAREGDGRGAPGNFGRWAEQDVLIYWTPLDYAQAASQSFVAPDPLLHRAWSAVVGFSLDHSIALHTGFL